METIQKTLILASVLTMLFSCGIQRNISDSKGKITVKDTVSVADSTEYELIVFDPGFDYWFNSRGLSKSQYSNDYLRSVNLQYVNEWNSRFNRGDKRIDSHIDYDPFIKYDLDFNYKLFMYFKYFEESYRIKLIPGRR